MDQQYAKIAEDLLNRPLTAADAVSTGEIDEAELQLGLRLPQPLKDFYSSVGRLSIFTCSFQCIYPPAKLLWAHGKLVFMEENQSVCYWSVDIQDEHMHVYQAADVEDAEWYPEETTLSAFLSVMLYYQYAQGSPVQQIISLSTMQERQQWADRLNGHYHKVAGHNDLLIYASGNALVWYFADEEGRLGKELYQTVIPYS